VRREGAFLEGWSYGVELASEVVSLWLGFLFDMYIHQLKVEAYSLLTYFIHKSALLCLRISLSLIKPCRREMHIPISLEDSVVRLEQKNKRTKTEKIYSPNTKFNSSLVQPLGEPRATQL
jgi:hypothetical protein